MLNTQNKAKNAGNKQNQTTGKASRIESSSCDKVSQKAYDLFVKRGCKDGHDQRDWFEAEKFCKTN